MRPAARRFVALVAVIFLVTTVLSHYRTTSSTIPPTDAHKDAPTHPEMYHPHRRPPQQHHRALRPTTEAAALALTPPPRSCEQVTSDVLCRQPSLDTPSCMWDAGRSLCSADTSRRGITCPNKRSSKKHVKKKRSWTKYSARCKMGQGMWNNIAPSTFVHMSDALHALLVLNSKSRVLDAACGCGNMMAEFLFRLNVDFLVGFDAEGRSVSHASERFANMTLEKKDRAMSYLVCQSDARTIDWVPSRYFDALIAHALLVYIPLSEMCDVVFQLCKKVKVGGKIYFGYMVEQVPFEHAMHCLSRLDVEIIVAREDHLFVKAYGGKLPVGTASYYESPCIVVKVLSDQAPRPDVGKVALPRVTLYSEDNRAVGISTATGMAFRYVPSGLKGPVALEVWGSCCTTLMIEESTVPCTGAHPTYPGKDSTSVVKCTSTSFASCSDVLLALAKEKCGCVGRSCSRKKEGRERGKK